MHYVHEKTQKSPKVAHYALYNQKPFSELKLLMSNESKIDAHNSSYWVYCSTGNIDMMSPESFFYLQEREVYYEHTVENKVASLPSLTFCENLLIVQEKKIFVVNNNGCPYYAGWILKKFKGFPPGTKKTVRNNEVSPGSTIFA